MDNFFIWMARDFIQQNVSSNDAVFLWTYHWWNVTKYITDLKYLFFTQMFPFYASLLFYFTQFVWQL